jgi:hypothetical protein
MNRRPLHFIDRNKEYELIEKLLTIVDNSSYDPKSTAVLMVSPDYSATVAMHLAHAWSTKGEIIPIIPVEVPYPTETPDEYKKKLAMQQMDIQSYQHLVLVEAGIIRGGNWAWILDLLKTWNYQRDQITLVALCENIHSRTKSDYVGEYYDDNTHELMFYFERFNKHWQVR